MSAEELAGAGSPGSASAIYRDKLELQEEDPDGGRRRRYRIYGDDPTYHHEDGTDFAAMDADKISVTPLHFELTDVRRIEELEGWELSVLVAGTPASP